MTKKEWSMISMTVSDFIASCTMPNDTPTTLYVSATNSTIDCTLQNVVNAANDAISMLVMAWRSTNGSIQIWC